MKFFSGHFALQVFLVFWLIVVSVHSLLYRDVWPIVVGIDNFELRGEVISVLRVDDSRQEVLVLVDGIDGYVLVSVGDRPRLFVGDITLLYCNLMPISSVSVDNFRYDRYLAKEGIFSVCRSYGDPYVVGHTDGFLSYVAVFRTWFEGVMQRNLVEPHASLLSGLMYGARSTLPDDIKEEFRRTGTMHIVAVSGYNVMLVSEIVMLVLTATFLRRQVAFWFVIFAIFMFVVFSGGDPSVVRAGIMGGVVLVSKQVGRLQRTVTLFLFAAVLMTVMNYRVLFDDVGFQLSFCAAIGLVVLSPYIHARVEFITEWLNLRSVFSETFAAILATLPISLLQFQQFSVVALFANLIIVPLVGFTTVLGIVSMLITIVTDFVGLGTLGAVVMIPVYLLLDVILWVVHIFSYLPFIDFS